VRVLILALLGVVCAATASAQDYAAGLRAFDEGAYAEAREIWRALADAGNVKAQYGLGVLYERGLGDIPRSYGRAAHWYARAAGEGHSAARNNLALMYANGLGVERSRERAVRLWTQAAEDGHAMAQFNLGLAYSRGEGVEPDNAAARKWFRRAAAQDLPRAQYALGQMHRLGVGVPKDPGKALAWYRRAAAQGHAEAEKWAAELEGQDVKPAAIDAPRPEVETAQRSAEAPTTARQGEQSRTRESGATDGDRPQVARTPERKPRAPADTPTSPVPEGAGEGYHVWLGSAESRDAAAAYWRDISGRFAGLLDEAKGRLVRASLGSADAVYRVLAGPYPDVGEARRVCRAMRAQAPDVFCQVRNPASR